MNEVVEYQNLLPSQFEERIESHPLVYVPVGSLEWHGEHLALGNDAIKIHGLCCEAARIGGGIVFPPIFHGIPYMVSYGKDYKHDANLPMTYDFLKNILSTTLDGLDKVGFKAAIVITGHTCNEQRDLMREVAKEHSGSMTVYGTDDMEWGDEIGHTSDHAAKWETFILWHLRPELVDIYKQPKDTNIKLEGVGGHDPRVHASRDLGKTAVQVLAKDLSDLGVRLLAKAV